MMRRSSGIPLHVELAKDLLARIEGGEWSPGTRLPSIREMAKDIGVSPYTVSQAVHLLGASGQLETIHGKGIFIVDIDQNQPEPPQPNELSWQNALLRQPGAARASAIVDPLLQQHQLSTDTIVLAGGGEAGDVLPFSSLKKVWRSLKDTSSDMMLTGWLPSGELALREWMVTYLLQTGIRCTPDQIIVTAGGQQALSLAAQTLLQPDDTVLVERPMYPFALSIFESLGVRCVDIPVDADGLRVDIASDLMERFRPKLVFTVPTGQVPTGVTMPIDRRRSLLDAARRFGVMILEDDHGSELSFERTSPPSIKSLDTHGHVIFAKSFSKITLPALRIGCLVAQGPVMNALVHAKLIADRYTSTFLQAAFLEYVKGTAFARDLERCRTIYAERRSAMLAALEREMPSGVEWSIPDSGFYLWLTLPHGLSAGEVARRAASKGVVVTQSSAFFAQIDPDNGFRLTFTSNSADRLHEGVRRLGEAVRQALLDTNECRSSSTSK